MRYGGSLKRETEQARAKSTEAVAWWPGCAAAQSGSKQEKEEEQGTPERHGAEGEFTLEAVKEKRERDQLEHV